jgi:ABC-type uncharacterized transport system YnjBCD substrate-binding protein
VWINGETFHNLRGQGLLWGPWAHRLPGAAYVDSASAIVMRDFEQPLDGWESPWGRVQFALIYDTLRTPDPPRSYAELNEWIRANPGRFTHDQGFAGVTFLKGLMYALNGGVEPFQGGFDEARYREGSDRVWRWLDGVRGSFWRGGQVYPAGVAELHRLFANREVDFGMSNNHNEVVTKVRQGILPASSRALVLRDGTIANAHYLGIPFNAPNPAGAMVVADFLLSPEAHLHKLHPDVWADGTVLALERLPAEWRERFAALAADPRAIPAVTRPHGVEGGVAGTRVQQRPREYLGRVGAADPMSPAHRVMMLADLDRTRARRSVDEDPGVDDRVLEPAVAKRPFRPPPPLQRISFDEVEQGRDERGAGRPDGAHQQEAARKADLPRRRDRVEHPVEFGRPDDRLRGRPLGHARGVDQVVHVGDRGSQCPGVGDVAPHDLHGAVELRTRSLRVVGEETEVEAVIRQAPSDELTGAPGASDDQDPLSCRHCGCLLWRPRRCSRHGSRRPIGAASVAVAVAVSRPARQPSDRPVAEVHDLVGLVCGQDAIRTGHFVARMRAHRNDRAADRTFVVVGAVGAPLGEDMEGRTGAVSTGAFCHLLRRHELHIVGVSCSLPKLSGRGFCFCHIGDHADDVIARCR